MQFLEEKDIGFDVGVTKVPLVCQSDLFDLTVADPHCRPDKAMGYEAVRMLILTITRMETSVWAQEQPSVNLRGWISV